MCANYTAREFDLIRSVLGIELGATFDAFDERTEFFPNQQVPVVIADAGKFRLEKRAWGFVPTWDPKSSKVLFNAQGETAATKQSFKDSFFKRRCLMPADGFFEWPCKRRTLIHFPDNRPFCFAGLWLQDRVTMLTCGPNDFMKPIHHRMPVILPRGSWKRWLDANSKPGVLQSLLVPWSDDTLMATPAEKVHEREANQYPSD